MNVIHNLGAGEKAPEIVTAVIEIPKGSQNKYEYDEKRGVFALDRVLYSPMHYPLDYGFIPGTRSEDGDHLDVMVIGSDPVFTGCVVDVRPVGLLEMVDSGEKDYKILAVQVQNPRLARIKDIKDVETWNGHLLKEIAHFMESYKHLEGKKAEVAEWQNAEVAQKEILDAMAAFEAESK
jgi:inorganic pyrophosphatase